jgi:hypothetical protein
LHRSTFAALPVWVLLKNCPTEDWETDGFITYVLLQ